MHTATFVVFVVLAIPWAAVAIPTSSQFNAYCRQAAMVLGRGSENQGFSKMDGEGNTPFERELLKKLRTGEYKKFPDPGLVAKGAALAHRLALSRLLMVGWVLAVIATELWLH